jgi:transposase-like protein
MDEEAKAIFAGMERADKARSGPHRISIDEFMEKFPDDDAVVKWLADIWWIPGPICPYCLSAKHVKPRNNKKYTYRCADCKEDFSIRTGTIFQNSHISLKKWIRGFYFFVTSRKGISSIELSGLLGIAQKSAWYMLQRIRAACANTQGGFAYGHVEVDETFIGGKKKNMHASKRKKLPKGRGTVGKIPVVAMRFRSGHVIAEVVKSRSKPVLHGFIKKHIPAKSTIYTDEFSAYKGLEEHDYKHEKVNHKEKQYVDGKVTTNRVESFNAVQKNTYRTYTHYKKKHAPRYLAECVFRLNVGKFENDIFTQIAWLMNGARGLRLPYKNLKRGNAKKMPISPLYGSRSEWNDEKEIEPYDENWSVPYVHDITRWT